MPPTQDQMEKQKSRKITNNPVYSEPERKNISKKSTFVGKYMYSI